jgi:hypothetical protein
VHHLFGDVVCFLLVDVSPSSDGEFRLEQPLDGLIANRLLQVQDWINRTTCRKALLT